MLGERRGTKADSAMADDPRLDDDAPLGAREPPCRTGEPASTELRAATASLRAARLVSGVSGLAGSADDLTDEALRLPDACPLIADTAGPDAHVIVAVAHEKMPARKHAAR